MTKISPDSKMNFLFNSCFFLSNFNDSIFSLLYNTLFILNSLDDPNDNETIVGDFPNNFKLSL